MSSFFISFTSLCDSFYIIINYNCNYYFYKINYKYSYPCNIQPFAVTCHNIH